MRLLLFTLVCFASSAISAQDWTRVDASDCSATFELPGQVTSTVDTKALGNGLDVVTRGYATTVDRDYYNLICTDFPSGYMVSVGVESFLDGGVERATHGKEVVFSEVANLDSNPGRRYTTRMNVGGTLLHIHHAAFVVGDRVYQLAVSAFDSKEEDVARFFDSLQLIQDE